MKRLLDYDPHSGMSTFHEYHAGTDTTILSTSQDVTANLEWSKGLARDEDYSRKGMKKEFWHYAHIPAEIMHKWMVEGIDVNDTKALIKKANSPEYSYLKTTTKKHV